MKPTLSAMDEEETQFYQLIETDTAHKASQEKKEKLTEFYIQRGRRALADGQMEKAASEFKRALEIDPDSEDAKTYLEDMQKEGFKDQLLLAEDETVPTLPEYRLKIGDTLGISIWRYPEITKDLKSFVVRPDGRISFPLVGEVWAYKMTPDQLRRELEVGLSEYIREPKVSVVVQKFAKSQVIVLGKVKEPGVFELKSTDRVLDAIAKGRGFVKGAKPGNVLLVRYANRTEPEIIEIDTKAMLDDGDVESLAYNFPLQNMDVIYVPKSKLAKFQDFVKDTIVPIAGSFSSSSFAARTTLEMVRGETLPAGGSDDSPIPITP
ncbi:MAG: hypothetical protein GY800_14105 [Planctomycetes bacterium]|nr:hypothetical protein [Planctomycetota bacterium]